MTRIGREKLTLEAMVRLQCARRHGTARGRLCGDCEELLSYALERLEACRFGEGKPVCAKCPIHCYKPDMRARARETMRWSGPRMILRHPYLAVRHLADARRPAPASAPPTVRSDP